MDHAPTLPPLAQGGTHCPYCAMQCAMDLMPEGEGGRLALSLRWEESGGPPVQAPARRGFGSRLIEQGLARDLDGTVSIGFEPEGVVCTIEAPLRT